MIVELVNCQDIIGFSKNIEETIDFETAEELKPKLNEVCDAYLYILREIYEFRNTF